MIHLSIVIVNYNEKDYLQQCLNSIYSTPSKINFEITVVDNNSSDDSIEMLKTNFKNVRIIENEKNEGFVKAVNKGLKVSKGKYVLSLNNDTLVSIEALEELIKFMDTHPEAGACGPKVLNIDGTIQHQCKRGFPTISSTLSYFLGLHRLFPKSKVFGHYLMTYLDPDKLNEIDSLSGAFILVRQEVIEKIGILDEDFIMYGDDLDWCYRIKEAGWKIYYVPQAQIIHFGGRTMRKMAYTGISWFYKAAIVFYKKHYAPNNNFILNYIVYTGIFLKALLAVAVNFFRKEKSVGSKKP